MSEELAPAPSTRPSPVAGCRRGVRRPQTEPVGPVDGAAVDATPASTERTRLVGCTLGLPHGEACSIRRRDVAWRRSGSTPPTTRPPGQVPNDRHRAESPVPVPGFFTNLDGYCSRPPGLSEVRADSPPTADPLYPSTSGNLPGRGRPQRKPAARYAQQLRDRRGRPGYPPLPNLCASRRDSRLVEVASDGTDCRREGMATNTTGSRT